MRSDALYREFLETFRYRISRWSARKLPFKPKVVYVEVSNRCNLDCTMCTRPRDLPEQGEMSAAVFDRVLPDLRKFEQVFFAAWGETLLSPHVVDFLHALGGPDHTRGFATNGTLLQGETAERILEKGAYEIDVSIDAGCAETYAQVRGYDKFNDVISNLSSFLKLRKRKHSKTRVSWIFVMMRSNFRELPQALRLAADHGCDKFIAKHLDTAPSREVLSEALYDTGYVPPPGPALRHEFERTLAECRKIADGRIEWCAHPVVHGIDFLGVKGPYFRLYLDRDGNLTPCTLIGLNDTKPYAMNPVEEDWVLGNVREKTIDEMIRSPRYVEFQETWLSRKIPPPCKGCLRTARLGEDGQCYA